jgi:hypothetical protein
VELEDWPKHLHTYFSDIGSHSWRGVLDTTLCDKVCQWLAVGRWFSPGTPVSSTNKTDRHDINTKAKYSQSIMIFLNQIVMVVQKYISLLSCFKYIKLYSLLQIHKNKCVYVLVSLLIPLYSCVSYFEFQRHRTYCKRYILYSYLISIVSEIIKFIFCLDVHFIL